MYQIRKFEVADAAANAAFAATVNAPSTGLLNVTDLFPSQETGPPG